MFEDQEERLVTFKVLPLLKAVFGVKEMCHISAVWHCPV